MLRLGDLFLGLGNLLRLLVDYLAEALILLSQTLKLPCLRILRTCRADRSSLPPRFHRTEGT
ncbi:MAG: hypothetical protein A3H96_04725 [Acidobacteria bacterium RIFCSPLOWO2_02_FULL_67_36]|nr:MAG: hypothetical protein A3H96_04725 [Acidobacteria bacterium RIFCSPLOWO2_02_FULL_67_36]OFW20057.1 MAG: hypothetical protein A3G21_07260 [Acidobacteria bacterium RIFCSPLOWO2_12_FULL_66_21]